MKRILHMSSIVKGLAVSLALVAVAPALYAAEEGLQTGVTINVASSIAYREGNVAFKLSRSSGYNAFNNNNNLDYFP